MRPNIILVVADDLDARSFAEMPYLSGLLHKQGVNFSRFYVTTPLCCPSRACILRGQYAHNHGVLRNNGQGGGFHTFHLEGREQSTLATWLHDAGYRTGLVGKYLNGYPRLPRRLTSATLPDEYIPPGWDEWYAQLGRGATGGSAFQLNENGRIVAYDERPEHYTTDVLARHASDFVERASTVDAPFFLYVATLVPHYPALPAPRHEAAFPDAQAPRPLSFDEPDTTDKPAYLRNAPRLTTEQVQAIDEHHADRLRSLLSLDELIAGLMEALRAGGAAGQTFLFVTSDHGWHQGEHRLPFGKETPYEEAIRGPLGVLGPGVLPGETVGALALNIDLAPTVADLAGAPVPNFVDGRSLAPLLFGPTPATWRRSFLVELAAVEKTRTYPGLGSMPAVPSYRALRFSDFATDILYAEHETGERELYDLRADPHQMENAAADVMPASLAGLSNRLDNLQCCAGSRCRAVEDASLDRPAETESD